MKKKILIAGGTGFIGYHLAKQSIKKGWSVTSVSSKLPKKYRYLKDVKYIICDVSKKEMIKKKLKNNYNFVVNLSGNVEHKNKKKTYKSHYVGCKNLADFFEKKKLESFIQIGSSTEYGKIKSPHKENSSCSPKSIYGYSKFLASVYLVNLFEKKKFPATVLRLYQVYGPKQDPNRILSSVILGCIKGEKIPCSHGKQFRDFIFIEDVINAIFKSLKNKQAEGKIFNIGSAKPIKIKTVINKIKKIIKKGEPIFGKIKLRKEENLKIYPNISKAKKELKWFPKYSFSKGLNLTINSYLNESQ
jgi:nucleoside-diphosphate-sugar epimerase